MIAKRRTQRGLPPVNPLAPSGAPAPQATPDQPALRDRRRKRLPPCRYPISFNLGVEIEAVCARAAQEVSRLREPRVMRRDIEAVVDAAHELMHVVVGMLGESRATDPGVTRRLVADLTVRPRLPEISDEQIVSGSWAHTLAAWVGAYSGDLAALLGRALPPGHNGLKGSPSASERLERALRVMDSAVLDLERHIPRIAQRQSLPSIEDWNRQQRERADAERAERVLAKLGVAK
ncbi:Uncharacterised protein [Mycobacteroides abscessus subsp. abscessus]|uniref:hypothetical protein n=1 Tax=Mycobacteroides abscessus TaxID=36809 RepID=UPI00092BCBD4|nr:hypothetical protein [Mycobacteroides abscessus]SIL58194.1 Uncharacterised protein [Mycobacteroides abscessus subsp. abscessus]SLC82064.1 Uncharacterised protein [Mycobacteroides abscessus subsp. abscessus]